MGLEGRICKSGCASPNLTRPRRLKIYAIRDFPRGCGPPKRFCAGTTHNQNQLEEPVKGYDSNSNGRLLFCCDEKVENESVRKVTLGDTEILDDARLVNPSRTLDDENTGLMKTAMVTKAKYYPRWRRISAIRCFPPGRGTEAAQINTEVAPESVALKTNGFSHEIPDLEMTVFKMNGEATESHGQQKNAASTHDMDMFQSDVECWKINRETQFKNDADKCSDGKLSGQHHRMNQCLERVPSHLEHPAPRVIVHALMAPSKFT